MWCSCFRQKQLVHQASLKQEQEVTCGNCKGTCVPSATSTAVDAATVQTTEAPAAQQGTAQPTAGTAANSACTSSDSQSRADGSSSSTCTPAADLQQPTRVYPAAAQGALDAGQGTDTTVVSKSETIPTHQAETKATEAVQCSLLYSTAGPASHSSMHKDGLSLQQNQQQQQQQPSLQGEQQQQQQQDPIRYLSPIAVPATRSVQSCQQQQHPQQQELQLAGNSPNAAASAAPSWMQTPGLSSPFSQGSTNSYAGQATRSDASGSASPACDSRRGSSRCSTDLAVLINSSGSGAWCSNRDSHSTPVPACSLKPCLSTSSRHKRSMSGNAAGASALSTAGSSSCSPRNSLQLPSSSSPKPMFYSPKSAAGMSPSQRLLFTDEVELSGPLVLPQCATASPTTLSARGSGSLNLRASPAPGSPASCSILHAAAVAMRLQDLGSPVRHAAAAAGDGSFESRAKRRSTTGSLPWQGRASVTRTSGSPVAPAGSNTTSCGSSNRRSYEAAAVAIAVAVAVPVAAGHSHAAVGGRRCTADIGVLQHLGLQRHSGAAAAVAHAGWQKEQQQRQRRSSEAGGEVRFAAMGVTASADECEHAPVRHGTPYPSHEFAAVQGPALQAAAEYAQNVDSPSKRSSLASSRQSSKGHSNGPVSSSNSSTGQRRSSSSHSKGDAICSLSRQGSKHSHKPTVSFADGAAAADGDSASHRHSTPYPAREEDAIAAAAVGIQGASHQHSSQQPSRQHSNASVSFAAGTAAADGSSIQQRQSTPYLHPEHIAAVAFAAGTAAADGDSASRRHSTPHPCSCRGHQHEDSDLAVSFAAGTVAAADGDSASRRHSTPHPCKGHQLAASDPSRVSFAAGAAAADGDSAQHRHSTPYPGRDVQDDDHHHHQQQQQEEQEQEQQCCCEQQVRFCVPAGIGYEQHTIERKGTPFAGRGRQQHEDKQQQQQQQQDPRWQQQEVVHVHFAVALSEYNSASSSPVRKGTPYPTKGRLDSDSEAVTDEQVVLEDGDAAAAAPPPEAPAVSVRFVIDGGRAAAAPAAAADHVLTEQAFVRHDTPHPSKSRPRGDEEGRQQHAARREPVEAQQAAASRDTKRTPGSAGTSRRGSTSSSRVSFNLLNTSRKSSSEQPIGISSSSSNSSSRRPSLDKALSGSCTAAGAAAGSSGSSSAAGSYSSSASGSGSLRQPSSSEQQAKTGAPLKVQLSLTHNVSVHHIAAVGD